MSDTADIFTTSESEARLDLIKHLIENSELVPLVRGVSGIGKSLLASRLQASAPKNWVVCHFAADSMMQPERLLAQIARCSGLPDGLQDNLPRLVERFEIQRKRGNIPVLLIDDAQALPPTSLITLLRLYERQVDGAPLVSLVLFADEQIDMLLSTPQLQIMSPQSIQVIDLQPLTRDEAGAFMRYLLEMEGLDQGLALDTNQLTRIYKETGGAPGRLASAILEAVGESSEGDQSAAKGMSHPLIWGSLILGICLLLLVVYRESVVQMFKSEAPPTTALVGEKKAPTRVEVPGESQIRLPVEQTPDRTVSTQPGENEPDLQTAQVLPVETPAPSAAVVKDEVLDGAVASPAVGIVTTQPDTVATTPETEMQSTAESSTSPVIETPVAEAEQGSKSTPVEPSPTPSQEPVPGVSGAAPEMQAPDETPPPAEPSSLLKTSAWLNEQAPGTFTIQLLAVENIESIQEAVEKHDLQGKVFTVRTERQGRAWYPLLWGTFADRQAAADALTQLPPDLRQAGAWLRSFASLRK